MIIQPYLQNTPIWQNLSQSTELITLRVITHLYQGAFTISAALIEIPIDDTSRYYDIIPVDPLSGSVQDQVFGPAGHKPNERQQSLLAKIADKKLPNWEKLHSVVEQAHALCPNVRTVGWDLAITSDGPIIIEGNLGWDTITLSKNPLSQSPTTYPI